MSHEVNPRGPIAEPIDVEMRFYCVDVKEER